MLSDDLPCTCYFLNLIEITFPYAMKEKKGLFNIFILGSGYYHIYPPTVGNRLTITLIVQ